MATDNKDEEWYTVGKNFGLFASIILIGVLFILSILVSFCSFSSNQAKIEPKPVEQDQTVDPINRFEGDSASPDIFVKRKLEMKTVTPPKYTSTNSDYMISPLYVIYSSRSSTECRRKISGFILYIMLISMFLACLFSSPDFDVHFLLF